MKQQQTVQIDIDSALSGTQLDELLRPAALCLREGGLVAFPTETVYGLGANALDADAVAQIFSAKGRPGDNPLIVHVADIDSIYPLTTDLSPLAEHLLNLLTPGPLTLILPRSAIVPDAVTAGLETVAVRIPSHPVARKLIKLAGVPVAAPSANRSGKPSPTRAWHVADDLNGRIDYLIDGGACEYGLESTVLDLTGEQPEILRPGAISAEMITSVLAEFRKSGKIVSPPLSKHDQPQENPIHTEDPFAAIPKSPGMKYRHYAPAADLVICDQSSPQARADAISQQIMGCLNQGQSTSDVRLGVYLSAETWALLPASLRTEAKDPTIPKILFHIYAEKAEPAAASHHLFDALRTLDQKSVDIILAEGLPEGGAATAYMNRLRKASGGGDVP